MATRKLQTEIDKVLKKVAEGVETFEEIFEKIQTTTNVNQKEKYESDLKKEIKKLQRQRDQIKTWISSNDIKDKRSLMDNRKLIEQQMERFKAIEKEMKTKAYSREGLIMSGRMDPKEKEKAETCSWVTDRVDTLNIQIEGLEAEVETLQAGTKKGKNTAVKERVLELEEKIERHKWHQGRLELILRLLENGQIETDKVTSIQEDVNYYVDENRDPDFAEDDEIYSELNLEEEEEFFPVGMDDHHHENEEKPKEKEKEKEREKEKEKEKEKEDLPEPVPKKSVKEQDSEPTMRVTGKMSATKKPQAETKETKVSSTTSSTSSARPPKPADTPVIQYATAAAANLPSEPRGTHAIVSPQVTSATAIVPGASSTPSIAPAAVRDSPLVTSASVKTEEPSPTMAAIAATTTVTPSPKPAPAALAAASTPPASKAQELSLAGPEETVATEKEKDSPKTESAAPITEPTLAPVIHSQSPPLSIAEVQQQSKETLSEQAVSQPRVTSEPEIRLPAALADLAHSFEASKERAMSKDMGVFVQQMLEASFQPKYYTPKNPYPTPSYYPQVPPQGLFDSPLMFEKLDVDTLFFIFYYQQGTYQQYLAAKELKKRSWRFHKKYLTWFQRHEEPKAITDDYEQGTYIYFDYEGAWCQRKKTDFRFEYKFLEDSELV
ncbi:general negative regulator of transcription subunit 5 [Lunasporangiospora selenospora]|uniref:General negative regulator of transcription subunit n=1 Tax=Lunasporangiospora selenospora TaxID=979761 RepID=A0A9P6KI47_9FUNG|nr:general negative regulator of transcription subunit 5 [Lunasporangiospora selenospora]